MKAIRQLRERRNGAGFVAVFATLLLLALIGNSMGCVAAGNDPVQVNAERLESSAFHAVDDFLAIDDANRAAMRATLPEVHDAAEKLRKEWPPLLREYDDALAAYRNAKTEENSNTLQQKLNQISATLGQVSIYLVEQQKNGLKKK